MNDNITEEDKTPVAGFNRDDGDMESAENGGVAMPAAPDGEAPPAAGAAGDSDLQEENAVPADISLENTGPERELDDARIAELLANPMFIRFARGRTAGMSYREYYELISELPGSNHQNYKGE